MDWGALGPLVEHVLPNQVIFITEEKSSKQILEWLFTAENIAGSNVPCFFHLLGQVTYKINPQIQDFERVLDLMCK